MLSVRFPARSFATAVLLACVLAVAAGCDTLTEEGTDTPTAPDAPALVRAEATSLTRVLAHFDRPLDAASLETSTFRVTSALDNGRTSSQGAASLRYVGGASNTVELTLRAPGLGNGSHSVTADRVRDLDGRTSQGTAASFDYRYDVNTPRAFRVERIVVTDFPGTQSNGDPWDWDPFSEGPRRPDIYVQFQDPARGLPGVLFVSEVHDDASASRAYTFDDAASGNDPDVPFTANYGTTYTLSLVDDDFGGNTTMVQASVRLSSLYALDNATRDALTVRGDRGFTAVLHGNWLY
ncbi:MAG: hypothetical protein AAGF99_11120 [Bacteroidota bacterium]